MPSRGPLPKPAQQRVRRNKESSDWREVPDVPFDGGPDLPEGVETAFARKWWETVRSMPHCSLWADSDWLFAEGTARIADRFATDPKSFGAELRQREKALGVTEEDRVRLKIRYAKADSIVLADVTRIDDYRELYGT